MKMMLLVSEVLKFDNGVDQATVSKRIILNGDNLIDAKPRMDTQSNETIVSFTLDRVGAKNLEKQQLKMLVSNLQLF